MASSCFRLKLAPPLCLASVFSFFHLNIPRVPIACGQREEEERKEEERRRTTEQRRRLEKERILKERRDAEERDRKMDEKLKMIEEQRSDCSCRRHPPLALAFLNDLKKYLTCALGDGDTFYFSLLPQEETGRAGRRAAQEGESKVGERPIGI